MNEVVNFINGVCYPEQALEHSIIEKLPYTPTGCSLEIKSINVDAVHILPDSITVTELDANSTFSTLQTKATHEWFQQNGKRTMIIARSAFAKLGRATTASTGKIPFALRCGVKMGDHILKI